jgi:uncharacterized protein (TIGR00296 family)
MMDLVNGKKAVVFARNVIEDHVKGIKLSDVELSEPFLQKKGSFVTIHTYPDHDLRGCIGIPLPVMSLKDAIVEAARSATHDPRFSNLSEEELSSIIVEVTVMTEPELINVKDPKEYLDEIKLGRDGLIVEQGFNKGLLLPQVPIEQNWDVEDFLSHTCIKAGLMPDAWFNSDTKIYRFSGQVFSELKPNGKIVEKNLNGPDD